MLKFEDSVVADESTPLNNANRVHLTNENEKSLGCECKSFWKHMSSYIGPGALVFVIKWFVDWLWAVGCGWIYGNTKTGSN